MNVDDDKVSRQLQRLDEKVESIGTNLGCLSGMVAVLLAIVAVAAFVIAPAVWNEIHEHIQRMKTPSPKDGP